MWTICEFRTPQVTEVNVKVQITPNGFELPVESRGEHVPEGEGAALLKVEQLRETLSPGTDMPLHQTGHFVCTSPR